jgi:hypothetical protein
MGFIRLRICTIGRFLSRQNFELKEHFNIFNNLQIRKFQIELHYFHWQKLSYNINNNACNK